MTSIRKEYSGNRMYVMLFRGRGRNLVHILCCVCALCVCVSVKHNSIGISASLVVCVCRWADGDEAMYTNWSQSSLPSTANDNNRDCVTLTGDGWTLHDNCAVFDYPFVCKMQRKLDILSAGFKH